MKILGMECEESGFQILHFINVPLHIPIHLFIHSFIYIRIMNFPQDQQSAIVLHCIG